MLSEEEKSGIELLVMVRTGQMKMFDCATCMDELKAQRNCYGEDNDQPVIYIPQLNTQFFMCPIRTIPQSIYKWVDEYDYYTKFPSAYQVKFEDCNPKWWESVKLYDRLIAEWEHREHEKMMADMKSKK